MRLERSVLPFVLERSTHDGTSSRGRKEDMGPFDAATLTHGFAPFPFGRRSHDGVPSHGCGIEVLFGLYSWSLSACPLFLDRTDWPVLSRRSGIASHPTSRRVRHVRLDACFSTSMAAVEVRIRPRVLGLSLIHI